MSPTTPNMQLLPDITHTRFSLIRFRSPLLTESRLLSLPVGTEMFHFPTFPLPALYIQAGVTRSARRLAGFPHSEILGSKLICQLPEAYRRLSRPSSPVIAKASTTCSYSLDPITLTPLTRIRRSSRNRQVFHLARYAVFNSI